MPRHSKLFLNLLFWTSISALVFAMVWLSRDSGWSWRRTASELIFVVVFLSIGGLLCAFLPERMKKFFAGLPCCFRDSDGSIGILEVRKFLLFGFGFTFDY
jgi:hypothetical protein